MRIRIVLQYIARIETKFVERNYLAKAGKPR